MSGNFEIVSGNFALRLFKDRVSVPGGQNTGKTQVINY